MTLKNTGRRDRRLTKRLPPFWLILQRPELGVSVPIGIPTECRKHPEKNGPTLADAGWYPDPNTPGMTRFYDGANWTEHVSGTPIAPPLPTATAAPFFAPPRPENKKANTALTLALVSLIVNPFMVLSIMAIVYGAQGNTAADSLERAGYGRVGGKSAGWAIGLGIAGCLLFFVVVGNYFSHLSS